MNDSIDGKPPTRSDEPTQRTRRMYKGGSRVVLSTSFRYDEVDWAEQIFSAMDAGQWDRVRALAHTEQGITFRRKMLSLRDKRLRAESESAS